MTVTTCTPRDGDRVEVGGGGGDEGLALTGLHLGDVAEVQGGATHELHVEVPQAEGALGRLADGGERLGQQVVERLAVRRSARGARRSRARSSSSVELGEGVFEVR